MSTTPSLSPERRAAMRGWILDYVEKRRRRRRRLTLVVGGAVALSALSAAAWIGVASQHVQEREVFCYEQPDVDSRIAEAERYSGDELGDPSEHAVAMCDALWSAGVLRGDSAAVPTSDTGGHPVPDLTLCVRPDQSLAVFPNTSDEFCLAHGMTPRAAH
ncbi:hypothetical protein SAMN06295879_0304 [Agreia bicolorata]|uniref:Uncharacterized protein n=1 Tax=Agreia bicolorata TaxID=110935 RepID=A0A1T4WVA0_9MICO|nr:hypothetical protein [Agreia bicolorata]SKA81273.1 hypothetical protein SAMN06295879_0304 [Agreia bicolorata]